MVPIRCCPVRLASAGAGVPDSDRSDDLVPHRRIVVADAAGSAFAGHRSRTDAGDRSGSADPHLGLRRDAGDGSVHSAAPAKPSRHSIVPLPPGLATDRRSVRLLDLRAAHRPQGDLVDGQARSGRPLAVNGVQHPAPGLQCSAFRFREANTAPRRIVVTAPHATAVFADKRLTDPAGANDPRTRIWVLLYAQVLQADGATRRNVLVARAPAIPKLDAVNGKLVPPSTRDVMGIAQFDEIDIEQKLHDLALSADAPLSVIAVELLPSDHLVQQTATIGDRKVFFTFDQPDLPAGAQQPGNFAFVNVARQGSDPLGRELGSITSRRRSRCSPLTPVAPAC